MISYTSVEKAAAKGDGLWRTCLTPPVAAMQSVSEDTPLWDEDDALDEAEV